MGNVGISGNFMVSFPCHQSPDSDYMCLVLLHMTPEDKIYKQKQSDITQVIDSDAVHVMSFLIVKHVKSCFK